MRNDKVWLTVNYDFQLDSNLQTQDYETDNLDHYTTQFIIMMLRQKKGQIKTMNKIKMGIINGNS